MLLGTCSPGALLARLAVVAPAAVALGVTLPSPASAQILQLNPEPTQGMNLSIYTPNYISFILPSSSTIGNTQSSGMQSGIYGNAAYTWTLSNSGTIFANFGASAPVTAGVSFLNGGRVTNTGRISGAQTIGVRIAGSTGTLINAGSIYGYRIGANFLAGGTITNNSNGTITGRNIASATLSNSSRAISISGAIGRVTNAGSLNATYGVSLSAGGTVTNQSGARITALQDGVNIAGGVGTVTNMGTITGTAGYGVRFLDNSGGTVINSGTITGGVAAVKFGNGTNRLVVNAGGVFTGNVIGGTASNTLELATGVGTGTLSGLGTSFTNFGTISVDSGANWLMSGTNTVAAGVTLTATGTLAFDGTLTNAGTIIGSSGTAVNFGAGDDLLILKSGFAFTGLVTGGAGVNTLELQSASGSLTGLGVSFTNFGVIAVDNGTNWTFAGANTIANGQTLTNNGQVYVSGVLTNAGTIIGSPGVANVTLTGTGTLSNSGRITSTGTAVAGGTASNGLVANTGTILSSGAYGVLMGGAGTVTNTGGSASISGADYGVRINGAGAVTNSGLISGAGYAGVYIGSGVVTNQTGGTITGDKGIVFTDALGVSNNTVVNSGAIVGMGGTAVLFGAGNDLLTLLPGSSITGVADGGGGTNTLQLGGSTSGSLSGFDTNFVNFSTVTLVNGAIWTFTGANTINSGVTFNNSGSLTFSGTLNNLGSLGGSGVLASSGVFDNSGVVSQTVTLTGGTLTNQVAGQITGGVVATASAVVDNAGLVSRSAGTAVAMQAGGLVTNSGTITGLIGVDISGGAGTLVNSGTVVGTGGTAVQFGAGDDLLQVLTGSAFTGSLDGGGGANTLEFVSGSGTLGDFANFGTVLVDNGASWTLTGANTTAVLTNASTLSNSGTLTNTGSFTNSGSFVNTGRLIETGALTNTGRIDGKVELAGAGSLDNQASGVIVSATTAVESGGAAHILSNAGSIQGVTGVVFSDTGGTFDNTLYNSGTITGTGGTAVQFGAGSDMLVLQVGGVFDGVVSGGAGVNTLVLANGATSVTGLGSQYVDFQIVSIATTTNATLTGYNSVGVGETLSNGGTLTVAGTLANQGSILNAGALEVSGLLTNSGAISGGAKLSGAGAFDNQAGGSLVAGGVAVSATGGAHLVSNAGSIQGSTGIVFSDAGGTFANTVVNSGSIVGTGGTAVQFGAGADKLVLQVGGVLTGVADGGAGANTLELAGAGSGAITDFSTNFLNFGAINLDSGGSWTFAGATTIASGVALANAGTLLNTGTFANAGSITGAGVFGNAGQLTNSGAIAQAVALSGAGAVTNAAAGVIAGGVSGGAGGNLVDNAGTIGGGATSVGVGLAQGGTITNTGLITGTADGVKIDGGSALITNHGVISGTGIQGVGVLFTGGGSGTIDNFGTISGAGGTAVKFAGGTNKLILESGGVLIGAADGSLGVNTLLVQGSAQLAQVQVIGFQYVGFLNPTQEIDANSTISNPTALSGTLTNQGTLTGTVTVNSGATLSNGGVVSIDDASTNSGVFTNTGSVTNRDTLTNAGTLANSSQFTNNGVLDNTGSLSNSGTISGPGTLLTSGSLTNSGVVTSGVTGVTGGGVITNSGTFVGVSDTGVDLTAGGTLVNTATGFIQGGQYGVQVGAGASVRNAGVILDDDTAGATLASNASMVNDATGKITGATGVIFTGTGASLTNRGTITGTAGVAVQFGAGVNTLTLDTGSTLVGGIDGGGGAGRIVLTGAGSMSNAIANFGAGSALTIGAGAVWTASGNWGVASVTNSGTLQPGAAGSSLHVTGNYVQTSTGVLRIAANAAGASSQLLVTGTASVAGSVAVVAADGSYQPETRYTILTSSGLTGQFSGVSSDLAFLTPTLSYDAASAYLTLARSADFSSAAVTSNQVNTAVAVQAGGSDSALYKAVVGQSTSGARTAFDALSGEAYASTNSALLADSRLIRQGVLSRMRQGLNGGLASLETGSTQSTSETGTVGWGEIHGDFGHLGSDGVAARVTQNSVGFATGVDTEIAGAWRIGAAVGYTRSDIDVDSRLSQADVDSTSVAVYGGRAFGPLSFRLAGAYGWNDISARRTATFPGFTDTLQADYSANTAQAFGELAYGLAFGRVAVEPFAGAAYVKVDSDAVREKGGAAALNIQGDKVDVGYSTVGARFATAWTVGPDAVLTPRASLAWQHTFGDLTPGARAAFQETGVAFSVTGAPLARDAALVEAGADLKVGARLKVGVSYQGGLSKNAVDNRMQVRFDWAF